ncbi:uncharacterized protein LOC143152704 [Ptiloglossa arizonensis]|uniref:uncharacterized protein LOC143152704 n=1 Tax=Ptiloglossa arizonensis TaxID=3350558 RepID=UPI003F9F01B5
MRTARLRSFVPLPTNWLPLKDLSRPREKIATRGMIIRFQPQLEADWHRVITEVTVDRATAHVMTNRTPKKVHRKGILSLSTLQNLPSHYSTIVDQDTIRNTDDGSTRGITRTAKMAGTARVTTITVQGSTKRGCTAIRSTTRVPRRAPDEEVPIDGHL